MAQALATRQHGLSNPSTDWFGDADDLWPSALKPASPTSPRRNTDLDDSRAPMSHSRSASNLLNQSEKPHLRRTTHKRSASNVLDVGKLQQRAAAQSQSRSQAIAELIDFLKNYEPPSESWTSRPFDDTERGRWSRLKHVGGLVHRTRSVPKLKHQIQLPDSAVSGTTIGGHRHIAISIPMEASPFGLMPRSQYPVYHQIVAQHNPDPSSPLRYVNDQGGVTVLRPVNEHRSPHDTRGTFPGFRRSIPPSPGPPPSRDLPQTRSGLVRSKSSSSRPDASAFSSPGTDGPNYYIAASQQASKHAQSLTLPPMRTSSAHGLYPPRAATSMHRASITRPSIDGIIAKTTPAPASTEIKKPRPISESNLTEDEEPILGRTEHLVPFTQTTKQIEASKRTSKHKSAEDMGATLISESPLATREERETSPTRPTTSESRRDKVRKLKQRDMGLLRKVTGDKDDLRAVPQHEGAATSTKTISKSEQDSHAKPERYIPVNTLSPIMIVSSIEPAEEPPTKQAWNDRKPKDLAITPPGSGYVCKVEKNLTVDDAEYGTGGEPSRPKSLTLPLKNGPRAVGSLSPLAADKSCNPTPPMSPNRSPRRASSALDRTSLTRRREWNATKCKARRVQNAASAAKSSIQDAPLSTDEPDDAQAAKRDQEFLRLYEAYREHRLRDMERRVRRLERHGDVWMRALVPVLDNLNRTMTLDRRDARNDDPRDWKSDDETLEMLSRGRSKRRSLPVLSVAQRNGAMEQEIRERLAEDFEDREESPRASDESGLDRLEPLMRELAGQARERLRRKELSTGIAL